VEAHPKSFLLYFLLIDRQTGPSAALSLLFFWSALWCASCFFGQLFPHSTKRHNSLWRQPVVRATQRSDPGFADSIFSRLPLDNNDVAIAKNRKKLNKERKERFKGRAVLENDLTQI
jgi:hypothetical protein